MVLHVITVLLLEGLKDFKNIQLIQATFEQFIEKREQDMT